jgi:hypothetical protein
MAAEPFFEARRPHDGLTYAAYLERFEAQARQVAAPGWEPRDAQEAARAQVLALNLQRTRRIGKTYTPARELRAAVASAPPQLWMILTEPWCGDSAQTLPLIHKIAALSDRLEPRILLRDENLDIMDRYLTRGGRGIPKLVAFDEIGNELFRWGPRPAEADALFARARAADVPKEEILRKLHLWYARDRGRAVEGELLARLRA